jgi:hypothetical protein
VGIRALKAGFLNRDGMLNRNLKGLPDGAFS